MSVVLIDLIDRRFGFALFEDGVNVEEIIRDINLIWIGNLKIESLNCSV
jgi:hypothetical protein